MSEDPWQGLATGGIDARRVDKAGKWDFFWWVSDLGFPGLVLRLAPDTPEVRPLPQIRSLDVRYQTVASGKAFAVILKDREQGELFATLCADIVAGGEAASSVSDALARSVRRTLRWHHLLRGGASDLLSLEEQRGLVGELHFLTLLCDLVGERAAIEGWKGPEGSSKDFEFDGSVIEIKARRGAAKPFVQISSEDQLADVAGSRLFLRVYDVNAAVKPEGLTLTDHVCVLEERFRNADMAAYALWEAAIAATGFDFADDYSGRRWSVGRVQDFEIVEGFPRISVPLVSGVGSVRYSISLDACQPFVTTLVEIEQSISGADANG